MKVLSHEFQIGDVIEGLVTGVQNYGVFVKLTDTEQGLVHISECKHGYVSEVDSVINVGDKVKVKVIDIDEYTKKISLSLRALQPIDVPLYPARSKKRPKRHLPNIGFKSLDKRMPQLIEEGLKLIEENRLNL